MRYPVLQARRGLLLSSHDIFVTHKRTIVAVVRHLKSSSLSRSFCSQPANAVGGEEVFHRRGNFYDVCLEREMSGIEKLARQEGNAPPLIRSHQSL